MAKMEGRSVHCLFQAILVISLAALASDARASEPPGTPSPETMRRLAGQRAVVAFHARLHWSEPKKIVSPDHAWELTVFPIYTGDGNHSPVVVRKRDGGRANVVLILERSANIYWGSDSRLLILDHGITNPPRILLFRLGSTGNVTRLRAVAPDLDADIRGRLLRALGRKAVVAFYVPTFGSWTGSRLVLRLGGTVVYKPADSPMYPYCYRVILNSRTARVENMTKEPARDESTKCQLFP
jgi:hypothetical protein